MTESWQKSLDQKKVISALSLDLSKAFDSLLYDILIAKLHTYRFEMKALKLICSYLINQAQTVKVKGENSHYDIKRRETSKELLRVYSETRSKEDWTLANIQ